MEVRCRPAIRPVHQQPGMNEPGAEPSGEGRNLQASRPPREVGGTGNAAVKCSLKIWPVLRPAVMRGKPHPIQSHHQVHACLPVWEGVCVWEGSQVLGMGGGAGGGGGWGGGSGGGGGGVGGRQTEMVCPLPTNLSVCPTVPGRTSGRARPCAVCRHTQFGNIQRLSGEKAVPAQSRARKMVHRQRCRCHVGGRRWGITAVRVANGSQWGVVREVGRPRGVGKGKAWGG